MVLVTDRLSQKQSHSPRLTRRCFDTWCSQASGQLTLALDGALPCSVSVTGPRQQQLDSFRTASIPSPDIFPLKLCLLGLASFKLPSPLQNSSLGFAQCVAMWGSCLTDKFATYGIVLVGYEQSVVAW